MNKIQLFDYALKGSGTFKLVNRETGGEGLFMEMREKYYAHLFAFHPDYEIWEVAVLQTSYMKECEDYNNDIISKK